MKTTTPGGIPLSIDSLARRNRHLQLLNDAGQVLTATLETGQVLERLLQIAIELIGAGGSSVWLWRQEEPVQLVCQAAFHFGDGDHTAILGQTLKPGQGLAGWSALTGQSCIVNQTAKDPRFFEKIDQASGFHTHSLLTAPMRFRGEIIGVLQILNKNEGDFDEEDLTVAESLAASASIAIENARLVEALRQQKQDLQAQNEELDAFAHTVAHNLKSPLARLAGFAELLIIDGDRYSKAEKDVIKQRVIDNAYLMNNIVDELLMLSSVRKADVTLKPLSMSDIVQAALARTQHGVTQNQATVVLPEAWPPAMGYAPWVEEVWENYLSNALKYGGTPPVIGLGAQNMGDGFVKFWVRDNGRGIPEDKQAFLFTPFTRLSELKISGYGLGLSIVHRIVHKLGGAVGVESEAGAGSCFYFTLPAISER